MNIEVSKVLDVKETIQLRRCISNGLFWTATVIIYIGCIRNHPTIDRIALWKACSRMVKAKLEQTNSKLPF